MSSVCPTITAFTVEEYRTQLERISFAPRIHVDFMDGEFAPTLSPTPKQAWWPKTIQADLHIMYKRPMDILGSVVDHHPHLVIVHAESEHTASFVHEAIEARLRVGIALLHDTPVEVLRQYIAVIDHVLIFSGSLGHHGGVADLALLDKVRAVHALNPMLEIGWDGGIHSDNIQALAQAGVTVFNVGAGIQTADNPQSAYENLRSLIQS